MVIVYNDDRAKRFRLAINAWGRRNVRSFPWRTTSNPYHLLLAEMMLRRTNAKQVSPVFVETIRRFPDVDSLSRASAKHLREVLRPLGLAWRAENIRRMAKVLSAEFNLRIPKTYDELRQLPGVGDYVASAVCSFAYNKPLPIIDSNTVRVVGRYFGFRTNPDSRRSRRLRGPSPRRSLGRTTNGC